MTAGGGITNFSTLEVDGPVTATEFLSPGGAPIFDQLGTIDFLAEDATAAADLADRFSDMPNAVRDFGVPVDGITDAGPFITTAAALLGGLGRNYLVLPNAATQYVIGTPIVLPSGFTLIFTGNPTLRLTATNARAVNLTSKTGVRIEGRVTIDGSGISFSNTDSVLLITACSQVKVFDWTILSAPKDVQIIGSSDHCYLYRFFYSNGGNAGLTIQNSANIWIEDFEASGQPSFCVFVDGTAAGLTKNIDLIRPKSLSSGRELVGVRWPCDTVRIWEPHSEGSGDNGISLTGTNCRVDGGNITGSARDGIAIFGANNTVHGTEIRNCGTNTAANYMGLRVDSDYGGVAKNATVTGVKVFDDTGSVTMYDAVYVGIGYGTWAATVTVGSLAPGGSNSGFCKNAGHIYSTASGPLVVTGSGPAPTHTSGTVSDGAVLWTFVNTYDPAFTNVQASLWEANLLMTAGRNGTFVDVTTTRAGRYFSSNRIQTDNFTLDANGITVVGGAIGIRKNSASWTNGQAVTYGDVRVSTNGRTYVVTNVGGTCANAPTVTSGSTTGADGITWLMLVADSAYNQTIANTNHMQFFGYDVLSVANPAVFAREFCGSGSPESVVTAPVGSRFYRTDGGAGTSFYVKESGAGATGWVGK